MISLPDPSLQYAEIVSASYNNNGNAVDVT